MKSFTFSLEAVLLMRVREEQAAAEAWARAVQTRNQAEQALTDAKWKLDHAQSALCQIRRECFRPGDQAMYLNAIADQKSVCDRLAEGLKNAVQAAQACQRALLQARMKQEVLARLKQKKMNEYKSELQAMEEAAIDDLIITQYGRRRTDL
jgi:flagellar export protein FliJ